MYLEYSPWMVYSSCDINQDEDMVADMFLCCWNAFNFKIDPTIWFPSHNWPLMLKISIYEIPNSHGMNISNAFTYENKSFVSILLCLWLILALYQNMTPDESNRQWILFASYKEITRSDVLPRFWLKTWVLLIYHSTNDILKPDILAFQLMFNVP